MIIKRTLALLLALLAVGCVASPTASPPALPPPTATNTEAPSPTTAPTAENGAERLLVKRVDESPTIDGQVEAIWDGAEPLPLPLYWGFDGTEKALDAELRALRTDDAVFFLIQWLGAPPEGEENTTFNKLTVHWRIPDAAERKLDCMVSCHTAFANGKGRFVSANAETIPPGSTEGLPVDGGWRAGAWTMEWRRPLMNQNYFDLQFDDLEREYRFFVKIFQRIEGRPDPVSPLHPLVFAD